MEIHYLKTHPEVCKAQRETCRSLAVQFHGKNTTVPVATAGTVRPSRVQRSQSRTTRSTAEGKRNRKERKHYCKETAKRWQNEAAHATHRQPSPKNKHTERDKRKKARVARARKVAEIFTLQGRSLFGPPLLSIFIIRSWRHPWNVQHADLMR